jgi:hypothetical protein
MLTLTTRKCAFNLSIYLVQYSIWYMSIIIHSSVDEQKKRDERAENKTKQKKNVEGRRKIK